MKVVQPCELGDRLLVVVDAQIHEQVTESCVTAVLLDDQQRRGLLASTVSAGRLRRCETLEQPLG